MKNRFRVSGKEWIITAEVKQEIDRTIGRFRPERGGILGSSDGVHIDHYHFDANAQVSSVTYTFDAPTLNRVIGEWNDKGVRFVGVIHSHPFGCTTPSAGDAAIARQIVECMDVDGALFTPIAQVDPRLNGQVTIHPYCFEQDIVLKRQPLRIETPPKPSDFNDSFVRIAGVLPPEIMGRKLVICVGVGGARPFLSDLARCGVRHFILIDGDRVEAANIATQAVYRKEIGTPKAAAAMQELRAINPAVRGIVLERFLDDSMTDEEFASLTRIQYWKPEDVLLCGCTDNFRAQDRCAQLALKYGVPYLAAQVYQGGLGSEVIFSYPGVTPSCPRCMLEPRYRRALTEGEQVNGKSEGSPVVTTTKLNAEKATIALQMLLYRETATPYAYQLDRIARRNFLMSRHSKAFAKLGVTLFDALDTADADLELVDVTVAVAQTPNKGCPLCGGTGDLRRLKGRIRDTRQIAPCQSDGEDIA